MPLRRSVLCSGWGCTSTQKQVRDADRMTKYYIYNIGRISYSQVITYICTFDRWCWLRLHTLMVMLRIENDESIWEMSAREPLRQLEMETITEGSPRVVWHTFLAELCFAFQNNILERSTYTTIQFRKRER